MSELPERLVPVVEPQPGTPEFVQRYAQLACGQMVEAMGDRVERNPGFDPNVYSNDQVVTTQAAVLYTQGPKVPGPDGQPIPSSKDLKVHTHPPSANIADSREFTYSVGRGPTWVTVQRGFSYPDANLTDEELAFLQRAVPEVRRFAGLEDE